MYFVQLRIAPQNPKTPSNLIINSASLLTPLGINFAKHRIKRVELLSMPLELSIVPLDFFLSVFWCWLVWVNRDIFIWLLVLLSMVFMDPRSLLPCLCILFLFSFPTFALISWIILSHLFRLNSR